MMNNRFGVHQRRYKVRFSFQHSKENEHGAYFIKVFTANFVDWFDYEEQAYGKCLLKNIISI